MKGGSLMKNLANPVSSLKYCTAKKGKDRSQKSPPEKFLRPAR